MFVPETQNKHHAVGHGIPHLRKTTTVGKDVLIAKCLILSSAEIRGDRVARNPVDVGGSVGDDLAVLNVEPLDFREGSGVCAVVGDELRDDGNFLAGVDHLAGSEEGLVAHAERVEVAAVRITGASVAGLRVRATAVITTAHGLLDRAARVRRESSRDLVGFPDVQLGTA